ncbi:hypothetical protein HanPI659440_Chr14g0555581 [Helianthus annuus]|nr:hypothetical protein HanPI659440_Chr14g0555581 [Helianthus annuus]
MYGFFGLLIRVFFFYVSIMFVTLKYEFYLFPSIVSCSYCTFNRFHYSMQYTVVIVIIVACSR